MNLDTIILKVDDEKHFAKIADEISDAFTKDEIVQLVTPLYYSFSKWGVKIVDGDGHEAYRQLLALFMKKRYACNKQDIAKVLALGICSMDNLETLLDVCPFDGARELLTMALKSVNVTDKVISTSLDAYKNTFIHLFSTGIRGGRVCSVPYISVESGGYGNGKSVLPFVSLTVKRPFRALLRTEFLKVERPKPLETIDEGLRLFTAGNELEQRFAMFETEETLGHFDSNDHGLLASSLRTTAAALQLTEFFPNTTDTHLKQMRARMALSLMAKARHYKSGRSARFSTQMYSFEGTVKDSQLSLFLIFRHIKGFTASVCGSCRDRQIYEWFIEELKNIYSNNDAGWLSIDSFIENLFSSGLSEYVLEFLSYDSYRGYWGRATLENKFTGATECEQQKAKFFTVPYVRGLIFLLASVGCFDLAFDDSITPDASPYDTLTHFRPTSLGLFYLKLSPTYKAVKVEERQWFEADEKYLIVRSLAEPNPYLPFISSMATSIGGGRFAFTMATMLRDISTVAELNNRIDIFHKYVAAQPPKVWCEFFEQLQKRCQPFKTIPASGYRILQLRADSDPQLLRLLAPDTPIGRLCIRAEGYRLLVPVGKYIEFEKLLRAEGYMI